MSSPGSRLLLQRALLLLGLAVSARAQQPAWHIVEQTTHNETTRLLTTTSTNSYPDQDGSPRYVTLQLKCIGTSTAALTIDSDTAFAVKSEATTTLPVRLDDNAAIPIGWANLSLHQILLYDLRDLLLAHHRLTIDLPLSRTTLEPVTFNLNGLLPAMRENNCRHPLR